MGKALVSPGINVSVTDESFYASADARATVPLVVLATHQDKVQPSGTGVAAMTTQKEANKPQLITSSRELLQQFGNPEFQSINGVQLHGNELNEYGLLTAYRILNQTGRCWVMRADVDLGSLAPRPEPTTPQENGGYWFDAGTTTVGVYRMVEKEWVLQNVLMISDVEQVTSAGVPLASVGQDGNYAMVVISEDSEIGPNTGENVLYEKIGGVWYEVGTSAWTAAHYEVVTSRNYDAADLNTVANLPSAGDEFKFRVSDKNDDLVDLIPQTSFSLKTTVAAAREVQGANFLSLPYADTTNNAAFQVQGANIDLSGTPAVMRSSVQNPVFAAGDIIDVTAGTNPAFQVGLSAGDTKDDFVTKFNIAATGAIAAIDYNGYIVIRTVDGDLTLADNAGTPLATAGLSTSATATGTSDNIEQIAMLITAAHADVTGRVVYNQATTAAHLEIDSTTNLLLGNANSTAALTTMGFENAASISGGVTQTYQPSLENIADQFNAHIVTLGLAGATPVPTMSTETVYTGTVNEQSFLSLTFTGAATGRYVFDTNANAAMTLGFAVQSAPRALTYADTAASVTMQENNVWFATSQDLSNFVVKVYDAENAKYNVVSAPMYRGTDAAYDAYAAADMFPVNGSLFTDYSDEGRAVFLRHNGLANTEIAFTMAAGKAFDFAINGIDVSVSANASDVTSSDAARRVAEAINTNSSIAAASIIASVDSFGDLVITNTSGRDLVISEHSNATAIVPADWGVSSIEFLAARHSNWEKLEEMGYQTAAVEPTNPPLDRTIWYNASLNSKNVDILANIGGQWQALTNDIAVAASKPTRRSTGGSLVAGDIWVSTADLENFPRIYRYSGSPLAWNEIDVTDQTTENGILFGDVRASKTAGVDSDAPNNALYPEGILIWNTRASAYNVKEYRTDHVDGPRWVSISGNKENGVANLGRHAQRAIVVKELQESLMKEELRAYESRFFNLVLCPGYPEVMDEMITLCNDRKQTAFVIGDTPARMQPVGSVLQEWATNANGASGTGEDGLTVADDNIAIYYPWGLGTNIDGSNVMVPPSTIAVQSYIFNDNVAYPWFAPAGFERGQVSGIVGSVGYLNDEDEYQQVALTEGQRDTLYTNKINPIAEIPGRGLVVYGQKTLNAVPSALDRVNVSRLVTYLRYQLEQLAKPFLFEINDDVTRQSVQSTFDRFLGDIVGLRGIYEYLVVCDTTNNTPERIDRNELWIDIAIKPAKAIEFIYIPVRVKNTGDDLV